MYEVKYRDDTGYEWSGFFETQEEALAQAATDAHVYGGVAPQSVVDAEGAVVEDQASIEQAASEL